MYVRVDRLMGITRLEVVTVCLGNKGRIIAITIMNACVCVLSCYLLIDAY